MPRTFRTLLALSVIAVAALLSACGSGGSSNAQDTLNQAFSTPIKSADVNLNAQLTLNGLKQLKGPIKLTLQGPFESGEGKTIPKVDWDLAASAGGQNFTAGFISTGDDAFVNFQGQSYEIGKPTVAQLNKQVQAAANKKNKKTALASLGIHPRDWLTNANDEGTANAGGVQTDHVSAAFDVGKFLDDVQKIVQKAGGQLGSAASALTAQQRAKIQQIIQNPRVDVYVGKSDHVLRRLAADITFKIPADQQKKLGGLTDGTLSFSVEFSNVGQPQTITAPTSSKPITDLTSKLGSLSGALGGATGGSSGGGSSGGASTQALQKYSECLQKANPTNTTQLQKCADLLK
jgi:hypothetical protein